MINGWLVNIVVVLVLGVYSILLQSFKVINSNNKYNSEISPIYIVDTIRIQNSCLIKFVEDNHVNNIILDRKDSAYISKDIISFSDAVAKKYYVFGTCGSLYKMLLSSDKHTKSKKNHDPKYDLLQDLCYCWKLNFVKIINSEKSFYTINGNKDIYLIALIDVDFYNSFVSIETLKIRNVKGYIKLAIPYCVK